MQTRLVVDVSNLFWRSVSAVNRYGPADARESAGLGLHSALMSLRKHYMKIKPQKLAIVFEGAKNWRKTYTRSEECYSKRLYKGNRVADPSMAILSDILRAFEDLARQHTNIVTLVDPILEGDDLISGYAQYFAALGDHVTILSGDKDFVGQLGNKNISLINPDDGHARTLEKVCGVDSAEYFMFEKCMRGDSGDNVLPAFPRVRKVKLHKAFGVIGNKVDPSQADAFEMSNLMNSTWEFIEPETGDKRIMSVQKMYDENNLLMNLSAQPAAIRERINEVVAHESENHGVFNFFQFQKFLGKYELNAIAEKSTDFVPMFSGTGFSQAVTTEPLMPVVKKKAEPIIKGMIF